MQQQSRAADVCMLGLQDMRVLGAVEVKGELELSIETTTTRQWCRGCGVRARSKGRLTTVVGDVDAFGRPVRLRWRKRRWRCPEPAGAVATWSEQHRGIASRALLTEQARRDACVRVGRDGDSVAEVARAYGTGWHTIMAAVRAVGQPLIDDPARLADVTALGMDETAWLRANRWHHTLYVSGLVDTATGRLLDVVPDRTARADADWLGHQAPEWLARIGVVSLDPHRGYANAVGVHLGHAVLVVDHFHLVQLANRVIDDVRRRVQQQTLGHRGRKRDPLYRVRKLLLKACENLDNRGWTRLAAAMADGDPDGEVTAAWQLNQITRDLYRAPTVQAARDALDLLYAWADSGQIPELRRFAGTVRRWEAEILNYHRTGGASNGPTEAVIIWSPLRRVVDVADEAA